MATRNGTSKPRRNRNPDRIRAPAANPAKVSRERLSGAIEDERQRLARAESILGCLQLALLYLQGERPRRGHEREPDFAPAVELAQQLVRESINRLDSLYLQPQVDGVHSPADDRGGA